MSVINSKLKSSLINRTASLSLLFLLLMSMSGAVQSVITTYTDEATYLAALSSYVRVSESFEDNDWNLVRSAILNPQTLPSITNLGLTWENRFPLDGDVTTSAGAGDVHHGNWLFYASPHGNYGSTILDCTNPGECSDGFTITSGTAGMLYGVGGWFTGLGGAEFNIYLDDVEVTGAGGSANNTWQFYGVIDTDGFSKVDIKEFSGTTGDNNYIWADDFTFGVTTLPLSPGSLEFSAVDYTISEDAGTVDITVERVNGSTGAVSVDYAITDDTATAGSDYTAVSGTLNFADGDATIKTFSISILNNPGFENDETVNLSLSQPTGGAVLGTLTSAVLTITDADPGFLQFSLSDYSVYEDAVIPTTITVERVDGFTGAVSVDYASSDGTATDGIDYSAVSGTINFADGDSAVKTFSIPIMNNAPGAHEGDETVSLSLSNTTGGAGLGTPSSAVLTILDYDLIPGPGTLQFSATTYSVAENAVSANITVTRVGGSSGSVGVSYATRDGTATDGSDYTATSGKLSLADGVLSATFTVTILDDLIYEGNESLNLTLSNPTGGAGLGAPATASLTITEDDAVPPSGSLQFSSPTYSIAENGVSATITVTRIGGSAGVVNVDYADIAGGSAMPGSDYTATGGSLSFGDGILSKTFSVTIIDDTSYEGNESINLLLSNAVGASLGTPASAVLSIIENEPVPPAGSLQFSAPVYSKNENGVNALITVVRVGGSLGMVGVSYASADGSALAGSDYTPVSGILSFADGIVSQSFSVDIVDDADYEGDESLSLNLGNATGGAGLSAPAMAILTISENDPVSSSGSLQFSSPSYNVSENGVSALITVTREGGSLGLVGVSYASADGSATAGTDYTAVNSTLSFADGVVSQSFSVDIFDDAGYEGDESLSLSLSNPNGGAGLASPATVSLNISDLADIDTDGDGVTDDIDNCTLIANPLQRDTNVDGFGNFCDPDFNNDLIVNAADLSYFKSRFFSNDPDADLNGDGVVNAGDLAILKSFFFQPPGP